MYSFRGMTLELREYSLERLVRDYRLTSDTKVTDLDMLLTANLILIEEMFQSLYDFRAKALIYVSAKFTQTDPETGRVTQSINVQFVSQAADEVVDESEWLQRHVRALKANMDKCNMQDSGFEFEEFVHAKIKVTLLCNYAGEGSFVLPPALKKKKALINVDATGDCFKYAVLSILHYHDVDSPHHRDRVSQYAQWEHELDFTGIDNPSSMRLSEIRKFEDQNKIKVVVHVWESGYQGVRYN